MPPVPPQPPQQPPRKNHRAGRIALFASLGVVLWLGACGTGVAMGGGGSGKDAASTSQPTVTVTKAGPVVTETKQAKDTSKPTVTVTHTETATKPVKQPTRSTKPSHVSKPATTAGRAVFKVWGTGTVDVTYGSDSDNRQGPSRPGFTRTMKVHDDALYYDITAQLQGGGNVHCSVTIDGHTKTGHASGGYNICTAQLNQGLFGGWD